MEKVKLLLSRVATTTKHYKELARISGSDFNIFKTIKVTTDEVKHSAFLAELLNPKGSHGQGDIFLRHFVKKFNVEKFSCETAYVNAEKFIGKVTEIDGGRIDIYIDDQKGNNIIIENKIEAKDGNNQLIRYFNYSSKNIFYLTLDGGEATTKSTQDEDNGIELRKGEHYQTISYKTDIIEWLELCQKEAVNHPLLREGITHYINLIKYLTGESNNKAMKDELIKLITENPTNLSSAREIHKSFLASQAKIQWSFWKAMRNALELKGVIIEENDKTVDSTRTWNFYNKKDKLFGLWSEIYKKDGISIHWGCEVHDNVYFGFTIEKDSIGGISKQSEYRKYRDIVKSLDKSYINSDWWLGWQKTSPELDFRIFNSEAIYSITNQNELNHIVDCIASKAISEIKSFLSELNKQ